MVKATLTRLSAFILLAIISAASVAEVIPFDSDQWTLASAEIIEHLGRECLVGSARLADINFTNGIIEYDIAVDGSRSYPGIRFRASSQLEYENFYIRPHVSGRPDALQYTAAFGGVAAWQLYSGPGFTASADIPTDEWLHVRLEIKNQRARIFFGEGEDPVLVIDKLKHEVAPGSIAIQSAPNRSACFSNFSVSKTDDLDFGPEPDPVFPRGLITEWELSQVYLASDLDTEAYPGAELPEPIEWSSVSAELGGLLDITRHVPRSPRGEAELIYARVFLDAPEEEIRKFSFGYSDYVSIFLNGEPLFFGNSAYQSRDETFTGVVGLHDMLYLPLHEGRNELVFAVVETFGGWGLMGQDNSDDYFHADLKEVWRLTEGNRKPESALYDAERDLLYVTQYFSSGNEYISRISLAGEVLDREWVAGLNRPTGMAIQNGRLWVVDRRNLIEIDMDAGEIAMSHPIPGAKFPNDVSFDSDGRAYISDTARHCIHRYTDGEFEIWLEGDMIDQPNGMLVDGTRLLFGNQGDGCLKSVDLVTREVQKLACFGDDSNIDGLRPDGRGGFIVSDFAGRVFQVSAAGEITEWLNTTASGAYSADLEYIPERGLLIVPGLYDNRLSAYRSEGLEQD